VTTAMLAREAFSCNCSMIWAFSCLFIYHSSSLRPGKQVKALSEQDV
jgi:hypothetical protein